jgi:hypothetical protein
MKVAPSRLRFNLSCSSSKFPRSEGPMGEDVISHLFGVSKQNPRQVVSPAKLP